MMSRILQSHPSSPDQVQPLLLPLSMENPVGTADETETVDAYPTKGEGTNLTRSTASQPSQNLIAAMKDYLSKLVEETNQSLISFLEKE